jgi:hypothetical protein
VAALFLLLPTGSSVALFVVFLLNRTMCLESYQLAAPRSAVPSLKKLTGRFKLEESASLVRAKASVVIFPPSKSPTRTSGRI